MPADSYNSPRDNQHPSNEQGTCASTLIVILLTLVLPDLIQGSSLLTSLVPSPANPAASPLGPTGVLAYSFVNAT